MMNVITPKAIPIERLQHILEEDLRENFKRD